jgi:tetratricopeptide (TPR) repeat protein
MQKIIEIKEEIFKRIHNKDYLSKDEFFDFYCKIEDEENRLEETGQLLHEDRISISNTIMDILRNNFNPSEQESQEIQHYKNDHIKNLLLYGTYRKSENVLDPMAKKSFEDALRINRNLPHAYYRLGHIHYRKHEYAQAICHFEKALITNDRAQKQFMIDEMQIENAKKIISYCAIKIFYANSEGSLDNTHYQELNDTLTRFFEKSDMEASINNPVLEIWKDNSLVSRGQITKSEYDDILCDLDIDSSKLAIDRYKFPHYINYHTNDSVEIDISYLNLLVACIRNDAMNRTDYIDSINEDTTSLRNSFNQKIRRLRMLLSDVGLEEPNFKIINPRGQDPSVESDLTIYYFHKITD